MSVAILVPSCLYRGAQASVMSEPLKKAARYASCDCDTDALCDCAYENLTESQLSLPESLPETQLCGESHQPETARWDPPPLNGMNVIDCLDQARVHLMDAQMHVHNEIKNEMIEKAVKELVRIERMLVGKSSQSITSSSN